MKKSLSFLLAIAMVFGLFASVVSAADDADLTTQQKFDALKEKGIFAGVEDGSAALDRGMTRAEGARIIALLKGLEGIGVDEDTRVVTEKPFPDVELGQWYTEEIDAVKEDGSFRGMGDGNFEPNGPFQVQQLAVAVAAALGFDADNAPAVEIEGAASWAGSSIQFLLDNGYAVPTNYAEPATRGQLVDAAFVADSILDPAVPEKVSVASATATGVKKVEVKLDKAVDTEEATLTLKKGSVTVGTETEWAEDGKSATLTLKDSAKISEGNYSVTLAGVEDIANASAEFSAENETVTKIEFVTASEQIAVSKKAKVKLRAENQYGELASFGASYYTVNAMTTSPSVKKDSEGYLIVTMDTETSASLLPGVSTIPVYVSFDNNRVTATKNFKLGTPPFVSKMELGDVQYSNKGEQISAQGETATVVLNLFDQFGNPFTPEQEDVTSKPNINAFVNPYTDALLIDWSDTSDDTYKVKVTIKATNDATKKIEVAQDYSLTVYAGSASQTTTVKVGPSKLAMKVKIGDAESVLAAGDSGVKYIKLDVFDANDEPLTAQEIVDNSARITVNVSNGGSAGAIQRTGKNKGKIVFTGVPNSPNSYVFVTASISSPNTNSYDNKQFKIEAARVPDHIEVTKKPDVKAVESATSEFELKVKDQYGEDIGLYDDRDGKHSTYRVEARLINNAVSGQTLNTTVDNQQDAGADYDKASHATWQQVGADDNFSGFNGAFTFKTNAVDRGTARFEARLIINNTAMGITDNVLSTVYASIETIDPTTYLVYTLDSLGDLYATKDFPTSYGDLEDYKGVFKRTVALKVKDGAGNSVAVGPNHLKAIASSNSSILEVQLATAPSTGTTLDVLGFKTGEASVTATVYGVDGVTRSLATTGTVKNEAIVVKSIDSKDEITLADGDAFTDAEIFDALELKVKDQYGNTYEGEEVIGNYAGALGLSFTVTDLVATAAGLTPSASINFTGRVPDTIAIGPNTAGFTLNIVSADGSVVASVAVKVTAII